MIAADDVGGKKGEVRDDRDDDDKDDPKAEVLDRPADTSAACEWKGCRRAGARAPLIPSPRPHDRKPETDFVRNSKL
jgi:hypothetical protein